MALNVGINGFGRIGRIIFRTCSQNPCLKVSAINDPAVDIDYICYLIKFDSTHGTFRCSVDRSDNEIIVDGHKIAIFREKLPTNIPWHIADVQYVVEASGMFTSLEKASGHLASESVKRVLVTAPSVDVPMVVLGVNDDKLSAENKVISCASSTLYCLAPIIKILEDQFGVFEGFITSIHAMTPSLKPLDGLCLKGKHWRDHRSIHQNIIPATTGACRALGKIIPQVKDKMNGLAFRVPIVNVSVLDITIRLKSSTTLKDIIKCVENAGNINMHNIIKVSNEQAVSSDFIGETCSCILDSDSCLQLTPDFFKLICWYENEYSYACRIIDSIFFLERQYQLEWKSKTSYIKPTPKQSLVHERECHNKITYHQTCSYECHSNSKSLCSTSQDSGFKSPKRLPLTKKPVPLQNFETRKSQMNDSSNNKLFKIWNDVDGIVRTPLRHNRNSFFHSCVAITPQPTTNMQVKTQERLETVKREFSKMVIMTENLLKQSQKSNIEIELSEVPPNDEVDANIQMVKTCDETNCPLDKRDEYYFNILADYNDKHNGKKNNIEEVISKENKINLLNCGNIEMCNRSVIKDDNNYSYDERKKMKNISSKPIFVCTEDNPSYTIDNELNNGGVALNKSETQEKVKNVIEDNNPMHAPILTYVSKNHNESQNYTLADKKDKPSPVNNYEGITRTDKNEYLRKETTQELRNPYPISNPSPLIAPETVSNKLEQSDTQLYEENTGSQNEQGRNLQMRLEGILNKLTINSRVVSEKPSTCFSCINTTTTASNRDIKNKQDIYDKLDSISATDSENSFHMKERKSQVINIADLTNSLEDLERLDKICRIIEISDELSDQLLSTLSTNDRKELKNKKWSFKDLCEKIKLDDFCARMFTKNN